MRIRKSVIVASSTALALALALGAGLLRSAAQPSLPLYPPPRMPLDPLTLALPAFPPAARRAVAATIQEYGDPDFVSGRAIQWDNRGPYTRIMVFSHPTRHLFPEPHEDILLQEVRLSVPPGKAADLLRFDGSLLIDRTRGTLASYCDSEPTNRLALNLAHDIIEGRRGVASARAAFARGRALMLSGKATADALTLRFSPRFDTSDLDAPLR